MSKIKKVLFDDVFFNIANTGIARVWRNIFLILSTNPNIIPTNLEFVILNRSDVLNNLGFKSVSFPQYDFWLPNMDRTLLTKLAQQEEIDLVVSSYYTFAIGVPSLMPVYDLIPERFGFHRESRGWLERELGLTYSDSYFAISENTKKDLIELYPFVKPDSVQVSYPGIDTEIFKPATRLETEGFRKIHKLNDYIVMVGSRQGYKNGDLVFSAFEKGALHGFELILVGGEPLSIEEITLAARAKIKLLRLELDDSELAVCISGATAMIYPSLYEGFGLPPLEALACGTPVVLFKNSSLLEAVGELGIFLDSTDLVSLSEGLKKSQDPFWRKKIAIEGPNRAKKFTWEQTARIFIESVSKALDNPIDESHIYLSEYALKYTNLLNFYQR